MTASTANRFGERQPSEYVPYTGASGYHYYKDCLLMKDASSGRVIPLIQGAGASNGRFLGVMDNEVNLAAGLGSSQAILNVFKRGEYTFEANGTGTSAHIGQMAYGLDDQTVGVSAGVAALPVGEIVGIPSTSTYRVRIDNAICGVLDGYGVSWAYTQN
jgi:hypothetical protein